MDENKIVKLDIPTQKEEKTSEPTKARQSLFQTNPILQKMFVVNMNNKKGKFSLKDILR